MIALIKELVQGFKALFPGGRFRYVLIILAMIGSAISISELLVLKFFVNIVVREEQIPRDEFILLGTGLVVFFVLTRVGQYAQRTYRVKAFARSFKALKKLENRGAKNQEWAMAFELSSLLTNATQLLAILLFFLVIHPSFALLNALVLGIVLTLISRLYMQHVEVQQQLLTENNGKQAKPQRRYAERIKAAESGGLVSAGGMIVLLGSLLYLSYNQDISISNTLIIFFGVRLQNASLTNSSRSLMRYAKAKAGVVERAEDE